MNFIWSDWRGNIGFGYDPNRPKFACISHGNCDFRCDTRQELKFHVKKIHLSHILKKGLVK